MVKDTAIDTVEGEQATPKFSNGASLDDLQWSITQISRSRLFNVKYRKWCNIELCLQWSTNRKSYIIYRMAPFSMILNDPYSRFQGHAIFDAEYLRNRTIYRHSFNGILIDTHTLYSTVSFRMILSDLATYLVTRSVAWSLCDSWASCLLRATSFYRECSGLRTFRRGNNCENNRGK